MGIACYKVFLFADSISLKECGSDQDHILYLNLNIMKEEMLSPEQSIQVIQSMIEKTKQNLKENSFYLLLWGWLVFIAALLHFGLMKFTEFDQPYLAWTLMIVGMIVSIVKGVTDSKKEAVKTYIGETMKIFGMSLGIIYGGLAFVFGSFDLWFYSYPIYILIYAVACFFMGSLMQFNFLKWAGLFCLLLVVASVKVAFDWQLLLMALAVLVGYIIPGHILKARKNN